MYKHIFKLKHISLKMKKIKRKFNTLTLYTNPPSPPPPSHFQLSWKLKEKKGSIIQNDKHLFFFMKILWWVFKEICITKYFKNTFFISHSPMATLICITLVLDFIYTCTRFYLNKIVITTFVYNNSMCHPVLYSFPSNLHRPVDACIDQAI